VQVALLTPAEDSDCQAVMEKEKKGKWCLFCLNVKNQVKAGMGLCSETDPLLLQGWGSLTANSSCVLDSAELCVDRFVSYVSGFVVVFLLNEPELLLPLLCRASSGAGVRLALN